MINISFNIELELRHMSNEMGLDILHLFRDNILDKQNQSMFFEKLDKVLILKKREYRTSSIDFSELSIDNDQTEITITIKG